ncbi:hypothetical protein J437_LFUL016120 [Ladona fulva]|uniref:PiggyBac transposable element-derived protein domain-containing protein n=1 Tax=Ladona fulva TaxID=123851 RepID=A0A8K0P8C5_LADFU|nr:hypothetical protein J437_LFUL016120 [Ladona fulva]
MNTFHHKYNPGRELVIDEAMVAFKGQHYIKQYMKGKPTNVGLMNTLYDNKTYACATTRPTRKEWPTELKFPKKLKLNRGESKSLQRGKVTATITV